jgi:Fe-Mn family superoxide dismutase
MNYPYKLPDLPYDYKALEPAIDEQTMHLHHDKHHQAYVDNLNKVMEKYPDLQGRDLVELMQNFETAQMDEADKTMFKNNGGGHLNHSMFWEIMGSEKQIDQDLVKRIESTFTSMDSFKEQFEKAGVGRFGSGWVWLVENVNKDLKIITTPNQDSPYMQGLTPIFGNDIWEHAYYLKYQNRRAEYLKTWWSVLKLI